MSVSEDGKAMMWDWHTSESAVCVLDVHGEAVRSIAVNSYGGRVFSCANDGKLRTWDVCTSTGNGGTVKRQCCSAVLLCAGKIG